MNKPRQIKNIAASVRDRLLKRSRDEGEDFKFLLQRYAAERFLYRLGESTHRKDYVLKGAMLFPLWGRSLYRATRDLDFTGYGDSGVDRVLAALADVCDTAVADDGIAFDRASLATQPIRQEAEYGGLRVTLVARLGAARISMQLDIGFGNAVEPAAVDVDYPTLLDAPAPRIRAYPREAVVAEKLHAMVVLGERNSRFKDFYDLYVLIQRFPFEGASVASAIAATFERRRTPVVAELPAPLAPRFYSDESRAAQWRAYLERSQLPAAPADFDQIGEALLAFLAPLWRALSAGEAFRARWPARGPWAPAAPGSAP